MAELIETPLTVVHVISCTFLILVVLLQPGKSGGLGAFSGAAAQQVFGGRGAGNFLTKTTWIIASVFLTTSISLAYLSSTSDDSLAALATKLTKLEDAAHANKAPVSTVKVPTKSPANRKADAEAVRKALGALTADAGVGEQPGEAPAPVDAQPVEDVTGGADKSSGAGPEPKGEANSATAASRAAVPARPSAPAAPKPAAPRSAPKPAVPAAPPAVPAAPPAVPAAPPAVPAAPPAVPAAPPAVPAAPVPPAVQ